MSKKQTIIKGTFILTAAGFLTRFMGFFYRIFLSQTFGEEGVGLYQLIFPVFSLCVSLTCAGMETAISRTVARKMSLQQRKEARETLFLGLFLSVSLSVVTLLVIQKFAGLIAVKMLQEPRCESLLTIMSYALPFAAVHSCICGYCFGLRQTRIPAISQLLEQTVRILSVFALYLFAVHNRLSLTVAIAVTGMVIGAFASAVYSANAIAGFHASSAFRKHAPAKPQHGGRHETLQNPLRCLSELLTLSVPLTANRVLINILQSVEAISIPNQLKQYSHGTSEALSIYGVLTGMAMPMILFPSAITSSVSIMLMPTVAEIQAANGRKKLISLIKKAVGSCFLLGIGCGLFFLLFGSWLGTTLFDSALAGKFIVTLAWICPFLYANSALTSVINGLGRTASTFCINMFSLMIRIGSVFFAIPVFGIQGYLWGMLISQLSVSVLCISRIHREFR